MVVSKTAKTATDLARDLNRVATEGWPARPFPLTEGAERGSVPIVVKRSVWDAIHQHGRSRTDVEVCGVLVGNVYRGDNGPYVYVEAHIRGHHAGSQLAQVTFTAETWEHLQNTMDREYPQQRIIGWYHTHPGFGIFLSPMDLFIHENFFSAAEQVAIVYDPLSGKEGLFVWQRGEAVVGSFAVEEDLARQPPTQREARSPDRRPAVATQSQDPPAPPAVPRRDGDGFGPACCWCC